MTSLGPSLLRDYRAESLEPELEGLTTLAECGMPVARIVVVPANVESEFYRLNNLAEHLRLHFSPVNLNDPDDEDIEDLAPGAEALVNGHYLLDEFIDRFYAAISGMPDDLRIRRPAEDGWTTRGTRESLLAVKRAWRTDWAFEALWDRLSNGGELLPAPRPLLLHASPLQPLSADLSSDASALLGKSVVLKGEASTGISRIVTI